MNKAIKQSQKPKSIYWFNSLVLLRIAFGIISAFVLSNEHYAAISSREITINLISIALLLLVVFSINRGSKWMRGLWLIITILSIIIQTVVYTSGLLLIFELIFAIAQVSFLYSDSATNWFNIVDNNPKTKKADLNLQKDKQRIITTSTQIKQQKKHSNEKIVARELLIAIPLLILYFLFSALNWQTDILKIVAFIAYPLRIVLWALKWAINVYTKN